MATLATLIVKLITDVSQFEAGMAASSKKLGKISDEIGKVGNVMTVGVTLPLAAAGAGALKYASDLNESMNKAKVVFGDNGDAMLEWSKKSATAFGLSRSDALDAAGGFGAMFGAMGLGSQETMDMSQGLVQLAADMGSLYNVDPSEMLEKLRSGMAGEAEPLRVFGVMISEANVKAQAMSMGLGSATGALTDQEKALARYALIQKQAAVAQGDFANTADGVANSTRILKAEFTDTLAIFGQQLLPLAIQAMQLLIPILQWFRDLPAPVKTGILVFAGFLAALGPVLKIVSLLLSVGSSLSGLLGTGGALAGELSGAEGQAG